MINLGGNSQQETPGEQRDSRRDDDAEEKSILNRSLNSSAIYNSGGDKGFDRDSGFWNTFFIYDSSFLVAVIACNFAQGFRRLLELGLYFVFKDKLGLQPAEITFLLGIMAFPWIAKIFLAIFSDNVTILGSRRKVYLIINSSVVVFSIVCLMAFGLLLGKVFIMACVVTS
jgi:hypothetical protein